MGIIKTELAHGGGTCYEVETSDEAQTIIEQSGDKRIQIIVTDRTSNGWPRTTTFFSGARKPNPKRGGIGMTASYFIKEQKEEGYTVAELIEAYSYELDEYGSDDDVLVEPIVEIEKYVIRVF